MRIYKILYKPILVLLLISVFFVCTLVSVSASDIVISNETTDGIKGSLGNDTINLEEGIFTGTNNTNITIGSDKNIIIQSQDPSNKAIIDCNKNWFINNSGNLTLINLIIKNANRTGNGGAIYNTGYLTLINCTFINNTATIKGGAIYNEGGANMNISGSNFTNNKATRSSGADGGAIYNNGGANMNINNSNFINNEAISSSSASGGAIYNEGGANMNINNSNFTNNKAITGGAIHTNGGANINISNSNFINNLATIRTGAIYNYNGDNMSIINSNFTGNKGTGVYYGGGAINNEGGANMNIIDSSFIDNSASAGGAIYNYNGDNFSISNSNFTDNEATNVFYLGGAIYNTAGYNFSINNSNFIGNNAIDGGAVYNNAADMSINNSSFISNSADTGGAVYNNGVMFVVGNVMSDNVATLGQEYYNNCTMGVLNLTYLNNQTIRVDNNTQVILFAVLTDDMGNTVTGQDILFSVNNVFVGNMTAVEGYANITFPVSHGYGLVDVSGGYTGHDSFDIVIRDGQLLIANDTDVLGNISFDKDEYWVNETANLKVNVTNNGLEKAYNGIVKLNLPLGFVLNKNSVVVSHGYYDLSTNTWFIGDLEIDEEAIMTFSGYFTKTGNYTAIIMTSGLNFNNTTDFDNTEVKQNTTPSPNPEPTPTPIPNPSPIPNPLPNGDHTNGTDNTNDNPTASAAVMKETGIPIIAIILVLLSSLGLIVRKR